METIQIIFEFEHSPGLVFCDALYLPVDHTFTDAEIEAMKQSRYDEWVKIITSEAPAQE
jgi:hypothetical protein